MFELKQLKLSEGAKAIYKDLSKNITAKAGSSFDFIRTIVRIGHQMIQQKKTDIQAKIDENNDTLSKRLADEANYELQNELKAYINDMKASLQKRSSEFFPAKRNAVEQFVKQMPSDSLGKKIQYVCDYGHLFDKAVWEIFINDSELASNYIAQKIVEKKAEENGIDYVCGFNFNRVQDNINDLETMVNISIANIDRDDNLTLMSLISENPNSPVSQLIADLDSDIATIIPAEKLTVTNSYNPLFIFVRIRKGNHACQNGYISPWGTGFAPG